MKLDWNETNKVLPECEENNSVACLVIKTYDWVRADTKGSHAQTEILLFNKYHNCWDNQDGDDYNCDIDKVTHWIYLPTL